MLEIVVHGEDFQAGFRDVGLEELGLTEAGDFVVGAVEDEDGDWRGRLPGMDWDNFGELGNVGGGRVETDAAAAVGMGGFDFVGGFSVD